MSLRDIFSRTRGPAPESNSPIPHHAVIDTSDDTLVAIGTYSPALLFLNESMMDTLYVPDIVSTNDVLRIKISGPRAYPEWSWDNHTWAFKKTNPAIITEDMRERAVLAAKKAEAISYLIYWVNRLRGKINTGLFFQEAIYAEKERQAQMLKDANFDERRATAAPYVVQYADDSGISLRQATEEILLQAQLDHEYLSKTEKIRLASFKKMKSAKTPGEIEETLSALRKTGIV